MTPDEPTPIPAPPPPPQEDPPVRKGRGCVYGGLAVIVSGIIGGVLGGIITAIIPDSAGAVFGLVGLIPVAILVLAAMRWKGVPGFLLGIGLTIALQLTIFTGCVALLLVALNE